MLFADYWGFCLRSNSNELLISLFFLLLSANSNVFGVMESIVIRSEIEIISNYVFGSFRDLLSKTHIRFFIDNIEIEDHRL